MYTQLYTSQDGTHIKIKKETINLEMGDNQEDQLQNLFFK